jgi:Flp pilus assembly protein TadG
MRSSIASLIVRTRSIMGALLRDRRGATIIILGFAMIPMTVAVGMSVDYARAARLQTKINAIADAAALSAVTTPMMSKTSAEACVAARLMFEQQAKNLDSLRMNTLDPAQLTITVTDNASTTSCSTTSNAISTSYQRSATVTWKGTSDNLFGGVLGMMRSPIGGTSTAQAATAPNIDFYVLLDASGSMALPSTSAGITLLKQKANGCAFACHSTNDATAQRKDGTWGDYYSVATSYGIPLRITDAQKAISDMMSEATTMAQNNKADYRAALATFAANDSRAPNNYKVQQALTTNLSQVAKSARDVPVSLYYKNGCPTDSFCNNDIDTASSDAFKRTNDLIPAPGNGTNNASDKPQAMLIILTDGMRDENRPGGRPEVVFDTNWCSTIKNRNIGIAILYTEYLKESVDNNSWSVDPNQGNIVNRLPLIEPALKSCVSRPEYFTKVTSDQDISTALKNLFRTLVKTAYITK